MDCTFVFALCILLFIIDITIIVRNLQENQVLVHVWLFAHTLYTMYFLAGILRFEPLCITKLHQIEGPFLLSASNALLTFFFLMIVFVCRQQLKVQQNRNIRQVLPNTIPMEVQQDVINEHNQDRPPPYSELFQPTPQESR
jgi:hypothetical protein